MQPWYPKLKSLIDEGVIGEPYQVSFWLRPGDGQGPEAYLSRQPYFQQMERFLVHETAIHLIDTFRYLFGEVTGVYSQMVKLNPVIAGEDSGGTLRLNGSGKIRLRKHGENNWVEVDYDWLDRDYAGDCVYLTQKHVVDHLLTGSPVLNTGRDYLTNLYIEEAEYRSSDSGQIILLT
ncbi:MAG: hypothetical protein GY703_11075 [Gammaproteobacteria bacterium]|nr:hypothetical protein [Gammaproteobacteria bacterium]